ncbi:6-hydroxymethylpterin diphosphokinase MptE-like protein [Paenibacillus sp. ALJ109b]|uniref:motility associated factor glycosyltransferase family protein n=1 Tax=Paenibacillus sp. ALJ109b TaxID=2709068 RepID=UPI0013D00578|nr:6-hydroxymethylpterin diphosphokinase MptE-like protein [Paenibacillus sp. ALJ109b]NEU62424.1 motility associated factor glycosyltransferase family protein [Paenibacillus sp. ALJ109b]
MLNYERNLAVIKKRFPHVLEENFIIKEFVQDGLKLTESLEKDHEWLAAVEASVGGLKSIFVYGFGQGLGLSDLVELYPDRIFFVYEPDEQSFINAMHHIDLTFVLEHPNIYAISVGNKQLDNLFSIMSTHIQNEMAFVASRYYIEQQIEVLQSTKNKYLDYKKIFESNQNVRDLFRHDWIRNSLFQIPTMLKIPSLNQVIGQLKGATAIVVSSGPSLEKDIHWLEKLKQHAIIISAGSSIQALAKHGIEPHLAIVMDGGEINSKIFSSEEAKRAPLLFASTAYYQVSDAKEDGLIYGVLNNDDVTSYFMDIGQKEKILHPNPTVAGTAIQAAAWLGCTRIILMGQDLSFPGEQFYAEGINHADQGYIDETIKKAEHNVINVNGEYNRTTAGFLQMKERIENLIAILPEIEFVNSTRNGAQVEGSTWKPAEDVFEILKKEEIDKNIITNLIEQSKSLTLDSTKVEKVKEKLIRTKDDIFSLVTDIDQTLKLVNKIRELSRTKPAKCQKNLELIEQNWANIVNRDWFNPLYETLIPVEIGRFDKELPSIITEINIIRKSDLIAEHLGELLQQILKQSSFLTEVLSESIERMDGLQPERSFNVRI